MLLITMFILGFVTGAIVHKSYESGLITDLSEGKRKRKPKRVIQAGDQIMVNIFGHYENGIAHQVDYKNRMALVTYEPRIEFATPTWKPFKDITLVHSDDKLPA